jgi:hypothetical protein
MFILTYVRNNTDSTEGCAYEYKAYISCIQYTKRENTYIYENVENYNPIFDTLHEHNRYRQKGKRTAEYQPAVPA